MRSTALGTGGWPITWPTTGAASRLLKRTHASLRCYVDVKSQHTRPLFLMTLLLPRPKRDLLPYVARHTSRHTSLQCALSKAQSPGLSVSIANLQELSV